MALKKEAAFASAFALYLSSFVRRQENKHYFRAEKEVYRRSAGEEKRRKEEKKGG